MFFFSVIGAIQMRYDDDDDDDDAGRRVRPTRYVSARVQELPRTKLHRPLAYTWPWQLIAHARLAYQFWSSYKPSLSVDMIHF